MGGKQFQAFFYGDACLCAQLVVFQQEAGVGRIQFEGLLHAFQRLVYVFSLIVIVDGKITPVHGKVRRAFSGFFPMQGRFLVLLLVIEQAAQIIVGVRRFAEQGGSAF